MHHKLSIFLSLIWIGILTGMERLDVIDEGISWAGFALHNELRYETDDNLPEKSSWTEMHFAAQNGDEERLKKQIDSDCDVNSADGRGWTPLHIAVKNNHENVVKRLITAPTVTINCCTSKGKTPLHIACQQGNQAMVKLILTAQEVDAALSDEDGNTPLHCAAINGHGETIQLLITSKKSKINGKNNKQMTPLHLAVKYGHKDVVRFLLSMPSLVDHNAVTKKGWTPLDVALKKPLPSIIQGLLLSGSKFSFNQNKGMMHNFAGTIGTNNYAASILQKIFNDEPLVLAALFNNVKQLKNQAKNTTDKLAIRRALFYAIGQGNIEASLHLVSCLNNSQLHDILQHLILLLKKGLPHQERTFYSTIVQHINKQKEGHCVALNDAVKQGKLEELKTLLLDASDRNSKELFSLLELAITCAQPRCFECF